MVSRLPDCHAHDIPIYFPLNCSRQLLRALEFLNERCKIIVGGLSVHSIFLTEVPTLPTKMCGLMLKIVFVCDVAG